MTKFFTSITALFVLVNNYSSQSRIYGLLDNSSNHKNVVYYDLGTATTNTVLDMHTSQGFVYANSMFGCSGDVFNKRYFFNGSSTNSTGQRLFTVNLDDLNINVSQSLGSSSNEILDMEYDPFYNRILFHSLSALKSYDLATGITSTICSIPNIYGIMVGSNRAFDPLKQQYYYMYSDQNFNETGVLIDVLTGSVSNTLTETGGNKMMVYDFISQQYYRFELNKVVAFDPVNGESTEIATVPGISGFLSNQLAVMDYTAHNYMLPYIATTTFDNKLASVNVFNPSNTGTVAFNSIALNKLYYDECKPLIRKNSEYELMCTFGANYQWFQNGVAISGATSQTYTVYDGGDYYAEVEALNGDVSITETVSYVFTGISKIKGAVQLNISPNPFTDQTTLHFNGTTQHTEIRINDLSGRTVRTLTTHNDNTIVLNREDLSPGVYMVTVLNKGRVLHTQKLIVASE